MTGKLTKAARGEDSTQKSWDKGHSQLLPGEASSLFWGEATSILISFLLLWRKTWNLKQFMERTSLLASHFHLQHSTEGSLGRNSSRNINPRQFPKEWCSPQELGLQISIKTVKTVSSIDMSTDQRDKEFLKWDSFLSSGNFRLC